MGAIEIQVTNTEIVEIVMQQVKLNENTRR